MKLVIGLIALSIGCFAREFSVSGLSSGAYLTVQMQVAYSQSVIGSGVIGGGPYYCAQNSLTQSGVCTQTPALVSLDPLVSTTKKYEQEGLIDDLSNLQNAKTNTALVSLDPLVSTTKKYEKEGLIDDLSNLQNAKIWLFSGTLDVVNYQEAMVKLQTYLENYVDSSNLVSVFNIPAGHAFINDGWGSICTYSGYPWINNCLIDSAGKILEHIYGKLNPKVSYKSSNIYSFKQKPYFSDSDWSGSSMADTGYIYIPEVCKNKECKVHLVLHGCDQDYIETLGAVIYHTGYIEWAEANDMIVLFPQAAVSLVSNPQTCWDWWGYTNSQYATKKGVQMKALFDMTQNLPTQLESVASLI
eukprot:CAMPEP_0202439404 /NCGR_PEP_ID=MMETSP1345-20130828/36144_1 /ASSEMBLY_ACC=CAM_ASM_000843 /TAXON_ID=342563 /ORGANISM="Fabrea Fabrea salina" /LENGTH=356 /DNA_ID=CAMNT_0049053935 /DNA_START=368 /DNA_END=1439 /DNA_ORIENTATION=+